MSAREEIVMHTRLSRRIVLFAPAALAAATAGRVVVAQSTPPPGLTWVEGAPIPQERSELAAAVIEEQIYVVGGFGGGERVDRYDVATATWERVADLPVGVHHPGVAALDGILYVGGGYTGSGHGAVDHVWAYDRDMDAWEERAPLPVANGALGLAAVEGTLYAVGGATERLGGPVHGGVEAYDPAADTWQPRAAMPTPREHLAVVAGDGVIYTVGGRANGDEGDQFAAANEGYEPGTDAWTALPALPVPRGGFTGVYANGLVVVMGGERGPDAYDNVDAYDPARETWTALPPLPIARHGLASAAVGGTVYAITGSVRARGIDNVATMHVLDLTEGAATPVVDRIVESHRPA
ncbi:MAG: Kelch repeat-containing protein [Thermomicrobiales bacterium]